MLAASHKFDASKVSSSQPCKYCGKICHSSENCFSQHPEKVAGYCARRAARGCGTAPASRASISVAPAPVPCGSVSIAVSTSPWPVSSQSRVLDSGASFHVTSDQSQLAAYQLVMDAPSVQTAAGTSCPITHQGSLCNSRFFVKSCFLCTSIVHESFVTWTSYRS